MLTKSLAATSVALSLIAPFAAQADKPTPVVVTNTASAPVPVTGTINVGNSSLPVEVSNADPIPVSAAVNNTVTVRAEGQPVQALIEPDCNPGNCEAPLYHVPTGKLLIIEFVSVRADSPDPAETIRVTVTTTLDGNSAAHELGMLEKQAVTGVSAQHLRGFPVRLYAGPDTNVALSVAVGNPTAGITILDATISGRLVDN